MQNMRSMYSTSKSAFSNYQGASGISGQSVSETAKYAYAHKDETTLGVKTYGVKPFSHPSYTNNLRKDVNALRTQSAQIQSSVNSFYNPEARAAYNEVNPPWG
jgi:hypothetical protein